MVSFRSYPWEGKGLIYYLKDSVRNRPQMLLIIPMYLIIAPGFCYYAWATDVAKYESISRFKPRLLVYRDDDPKVRNIVKYDENGNRVYLEPKTK